MLVPLVIAGQAGSQTAPQQQEGTIVVPARPGEARFRGDAGAQHSEIQFVPVSRKVTMKIHVEDPNGYFIPNIRRDDFVVYEDGVRQKDVDVEIEHASVTIALIFEYGGRFHELNKALAMEVPTIGGSFGEFLKKEDKVAVFKYADKLQPVLDFTPGKSQLEAAFEKLGEPKDSEVNLYDALVDALNRMRDVQGRKAIVLISTGMDTFSKTTFQQAEEAARNSGIPIYAIGLEGLTRREAAIYGPTAPFARIDWTAATRNLETLARVSDGRAYELGTESEAAGIYDDVMENLRIRYVITYVSSNPATTGPARNIRVELVDPSTGQPLKIRDATGKVVAAKVFVQASYLPVATAGG